MLQGLTTYKLESRVLTSPDGEPQVSAHCSTGWWGSGYGLCLPACARTWHVDSSSCTSGGRSFTAHPTSGAAVALGLPSPTQEDHMAADDAAVGTAQEAATGTEPGKHKATAHLVLQLQCGNSRLSFMCPPGLVVELDHGRQSAARPVEAPQAKVS